MKIKTKAASFNLSSDTCTTHRAFIYLSINPPTHPTTYSVIYSPIYPSIHPSILIISLSLALPMARTLSDATAS